MDRILKIMVAFDASEYSVQALKFAAGLAEQFNAELTVVNVINQKEIDVIQKVAHKYFTIYVDEYVEQKKHERSIQIRELIKKAGCSHLEIKLIFRAGVPFRELLRVINALKMDLLVLGCKGRSNFEDILVGSTAQKIFHRSPIPFIVMKDNNK